MNTYTIWEETPLKWHKFLVYFSLPLSILFNGVKILSAVLSILQLQGSGMEWLGAIDLLFAVALVVLSIVAIVGGFPSNRRWYGPLCYLAGLGVNILYSVIILLIYVSLSVEPETSMFSSIIVGALFLALNIPYYNKRRPLFA